MFRTVQGGFELTASQQALVNAQRAITKDVNSHLIQVGAVFLKASAKNPYEDDWFAKNFRDTDLQAWIDDPELRSINTGFNLQLGWMDVDIDAQDPLFNRAVIEAFDYLGIDTRFRFGRQSVGTASHLLIQLGEEEAENYEFLKKFAPKEFKLGDKRYHVDLRSYATKIDAKNLEKTAKQVVVPGSIYTHKTEAGAPDVSIWYNAKGEPAGNVREIAATTPRRVSFNDIVRAVAFGVVAYIVQTEWVEGSRQTTATRVSGWLARVVADSKAFNNQEAIAGEVFCPVDTDDTAEKLLHFICAFTGDDEPFMRVRTYRDAKNKLDRNPDAKIPGWPAMENLFGGQQVAALRTVLMPGSDVSKLTVLAERYVYDESDNNYIDRDRHRSFGSYAHEGAELERRHKGDHVRIGGKPREAFRLFESSDMRKRVAGRDMYPDLRPGGIYRFNIAGDIVNDEDEDDDAAPIFNTWRGWPIAPAASPDHALLAECEKKLDWLLGFLTQDNPLQIEWVKKWLAWTFQFPGDKQQIAWVVVGGQGVGKSFFGNVFVKQLMGRLWSSASPKILDSNFSMGPFKDAMFTFIDEAKFNSDNGAIEEIKKLIRNVEVPGMEKFAEGRSFRVFSRLMFASNRFDLNVGQQNVRDRALYYTKSYDQEFMGMSELEFRAWAEELKPEFEEYKHFMNRRDVREHYMYLFMNMPVTKSEVESIKTSAVNDESIVMANMGWTRRVAKHIVEEGRIHEDLGIEWPFRTADFSARVAETCKVMGLRAVQPDRVMAEFEQLNLVEKHSWSGGRGFRFKHRWKTLIDEFGRLAGVPMNPHFDPGEAEGANEATGEGGEASKYPWKGNRPGGNRF